MNDSRLPSLLLVTLALANWAAAAPPAIAPVAGLHDRTPRVQAFTKARIVRQPGQVLEHGTILVRDGVIVAVGEKVNVPAEAQTYDLQGKTIYPGFVDAFSEQTVPAEKWPTARHWSRRITPELEMAALYAPDEALHGKYRSQGITARLVAPEGGIFKGQSALVLHGSAQRPAVVKANTAQHLRLTVPFGGNRDEYPNSPMGAVALARQTVLDAQWQRQAVAAAAANPLLPRIDASRSLTALLPAVTGDQLVIADASDEQFLLRADDFAREFGLKLAVRGVGREYRQVDLIKKTGRTIIVPLTFPKAPNVDTVAASLDVSLEQLMHWELAPENAARLDAAGVPIALTAHGLKDPSEFLRNVRRAVKRGLPADRALAALTKTPAKLMGVDSTLGAIAPGCLANLLITDGDIFETKTKLLETWVEGERFELTELARVDVRGRWELEFSNQPGKFSRLHVTVRGTPEKLDARWSLADELDSTAKFDKGEKFKSLTLSDAVLELSFEGKSLDQPGVARATAVAASGSKDTLTLTGEVLWGDGSRSKLTGKRVSSKVLAPSEKKTDSTETNKDGEAEETSSSDEKAGKEEEKPREAKEETSTSLAQVNFPLGDYGRASLPEQPEIVVIKNAKLWTAAEPAIIESGMLIVRAGKIAAVGTDLEIPAGAMVIDAKGKHLSPGIIDCHSHMATDGGVNEPAQAITAEVRIADFIDANDITIYRQLAGGVTSSNILHGSANPIGGQNQVIKLRWGASYEGLRFAGAQPGIKFALGENVKQANWGERYTKRYPQSRMGVEQLLDDAMISAREYRRQHAEWNARHEGLPPRRDLELDALVEILEGKRLIHCHSYRQDEILALLRVCEAHQVKIATLQHILEGYKVADAIARHGAGGSSFSDWWGYKMEVLDAIPYNGLIMHRAGIDVSFNSDDRELARHLNHEAAKAVKYGGVEETEALKFVTLNPAKQLRIDKQVGSLEVGKDADFVVWSGPPLSTLARCEQTWIDGRKYFDRAESAAAHREQEKLRAALIRKVLASGEVTQKAGEKSVNEADLWPREDEYCQHSRGQ
jgi:N-acetylglucosamine-6-phosphate deacetylase